jgi:putative copper resistance protein D
MNEFLASGTFDLFFLVNLLLAAGWYAWAVRRVRKTGTWSRWASSCFYIALALLALTYLGPIAAWSHTFFWAHMTQHLVVMMVVAPLLVLSNPVTLAFRASSAATRRRWVVPILRSRAVRILTNPWVTWVLFAGALLGTHFTPFYDLALRNHDLDYFVEQPLYLIAALLFYFPLIGSNLQPRRPSHAVRLLSLGTMMFPEALVGAVIYFASVPLYSAFDTVRPFGLSVLDDQRLAGGLMWALVMVVDSGWMMLAAAEWFTSEQKKEAALDRRIAQELADEARR